MPEENTPYRPLIRLMSRPAVHGVFRYGCYVAFVIVVNLVDGKKSIMFYDPVIPNHFSYVLHSWLSFLLNLSTATFQPVRADSREYAPVSSGIALVLHTHLLIPRIE